MSAERTPLISHSEKKLNFFLTCFFMFAQSLLLTTSTTSTKSTTTKTKTTTTTADVELPIATKQARFEKNVVCNKDKVTQGSGTIYLNDARSY